MKKMWGKLNLRAHLETNLLIGSNKLNGRSASLPDKIRKRDSLEGPSPGQNNPPKGSLTWPVLLSG